jgi:hypothetical protein
MVLIVEALGTEFGSRFWEYIIAAGYEHRLKSTGASEYYRFADPKSPEYPAMIELFSRRIEGIRLPPNALLTPLPIDDDVSSLSAILLDSDYYDFLKSGIKVIGGIPILDAAHLIPFKAKAWLDLTERRQSGGKVDSRNIRKHKSDIVRLSGLLSPVFKMDLPDTIKEDIRSFIGAADAPEELIRVAMAYGLPEAILQNNLPI